MRLVVKILKIFLIMIALAAITVLAYAVYVFSSYHRFEDNKELDVAFNSDGGVAVGREYSLLDWNVGFGAYSDDFSFFMDGGEYSRGFSEKAIKENINAIISDVNEQSVDFIILQEVDTDADRSYHLDESYMFIKGFDGYASSFAQNYDSPYLFWPVSSPIGKSQSGIMTFSKYGIDSSVRRSLPVDKGFSKILDIDRCYSVTRVGVDDGFQLCIYNVHISAYTSDGSNISDEQIKMLAEDMQSEYDKGNYVVCAGDFNRNLILEKSDVFGCDNSKYNWTRDFDVELLSGDFTLNVPYDSESPIPSCRNADRPYIKGTGNFVVTIDGFITSSNVTVNSCEVIDKGFENSDHNPVLMKFSLNGSKK